MRKIEPSARRAPAVTPMMAQWHETKAAHPDCLIFFRMGDFYELFFDDAVVAAASLNIALTKRGSHNGEDVPMAGVPIHAAEQYLSRLIKHGHRVAICEQMEDPAVAKKRGSKSIVRRDVTRVVTPGTITEETLLDARSHNHLAALAEAHGELGLAWLDMSTGELWLQPLAEADLAAALSRIDPGELLLADRTLQRTALFGTFGREKDRLTVLPQGRWDALNAAQRLHEVYEVASLDAFGPPTHAEIAAAGALIDYVELTQVGKLPHIDRPRRLPAPGASGATLEIDAATRRNLELARGAGGDRQGSLLATIDHTVTGGGARLLAQQLSAPLTDIRAINRRLDTISFLVEGAAMQEDIRETLRRTPDLERAIARLSLGRGGPRDLAAVRDALSAAGGLYTILSADGFEPLPEALQAARQALHHDHVLVERLTRALAAELPAHARDGGFIAAGYLSELDDQRQLRDDSRKLVASLQRKYADSQSIPSLKIRHNNVLGYYVEVTSNHAEKLLKLGQHPDPAHQFIHRQTMANAARFTTVELSDLQTRITGAADKAVAIEQQLFEDLVKEVVQRAPELTSTARALSSLDSSAALALLAAEQNYSRPKLTDDQTFRIRGGRHPVVETSGAATTFIANDCGLAGEEGAGLWLLTGPNMAGKSTFLRQNALIVILAQMGAFVPADSAEIGIVDRLFSRVGAADDLARGRSTFMVEMVETAAILAQATARSFVILDEIGRGTATFDGLSIAWATIEHLHDSVGCRTLFATHYHELTSLANTMPRLACHTMRVKEWHDEIVFLHEVAPGAADRSYGIHVARLAGLPRGVVERAQTILETLEHGDHGSAVAQLAEDLPLFSADWARPAPAPRESAAEALLRDSNPDMLSPRAALDLLYQLKSLQREADDG